MWQTTYRFDPVRSVPSIGGNVSSLRDVLPLPPGLADPSYAGRGEHTADIMRPGGFDQREAPGFHGCRPPYPCPGHRIRLDVSSSNFTDSIARLRYRNGRERGEPATPGVPMQVTITLYPTSNLRALMISST